MLLAQCGQSLVCIFAWAITSYRAVCRIPLERLILICLLLAEKYYQAHLNAGQVNQGHPRRFLDIQKHSIGLKGPLKIPDEPNQFRNLTSAKQLALACPAIDLKL